MGELEAIRRGVTEAGRAGRDTWIVSPVEAWVLGMKTVLLGVDPTLQGAHEVGRAILHRVGSTRFAIPMDMAWAQRVGQLREIQTLLGFWREDRWDIQVTVTEIHDESSGEPEVVVELGAIYVHDQILLEADGKVPGLEVALKQLDRLQAGITVSNATPNPDAVLPLLFRILATHHWRAFRDLYDQSASQSDKRVAFDQFRHAWESASGKIAFAGYVEPQRAVDEAVEGTVVRTRLTRSGEKGEVLTRPIKWVKRGAGWRIAGGLM